MSPEADLLNEVPLFQLLDDNERAELAAQLDVVEFAAGESIFNYGDPGGSCTRKSTRLTGDVLIRLDRVHHLLPKDVDLDIATAEVKTLHSPRNDSRKSRPND